jgi:putative membrane protein
MRQLLVLERFCLVGHLVSMAFGLAGLLLVMPHPEFLLHVPAGQTLFAWSMAGGGVVYILLGAIAVAIHAYRTLGTQRWLSFMLPALFLSLGSELLGTSTGFPFGHYSYLNGLGYKIAGLVPFTIPLSWFYLGLSSYLLVRAAMEPSSKDDTQPPVQQGWVSHMVTVAIGALLLTSWDFVLDPAMSQTAMPFWYWHQPGAFFGMPYQNFAGWFGTGVVFMTVAALFWGKRAIVLSYSELNLPIAVYLGNFAFATVMSLAAGIWIPVSLGMLTGVAPAVICWRVACRKSVISPLVADSVVDALDSKLDTRKSKVAAPVGVSAK